MSSTTKTSSKCDDVSQQIGQKKLDQHPLRSFLRSTLSIHGHRYFRRIFCVLLSIHIITLFLVSEWRVRAPQFMSMVLFMSSKLWPFPTFQMSNLTSDCPEIAATNIAFKVFEILSILLYTIDLVPKIFVWRTRFMWKLINIFVVTIMVIQVPLTMIGYLQSGENPERLKLRICSISLSFLLLCEVLSIREQRTLRQLKVLEAQRSRLEADDDCNNALFLQYLEEKKREAAGFKKYAWAEIVKHDKKSDCWIVIHGKVYDVTKFLNVHPGGSQILDGAGGDCTAMFESLHPTYLTEAGAPKEYLIGEVLEYQSFYSWDGDFYKTIRRRVEKAVPPKERRYHKGFYAKAIFIVVGYFVTLYFYVTRTSVPIAIIFAMFGGMMGVNIMHDGNHGAITDSPYISWLGGICLDLVFSTSIVYKRSHNFGHHGCVNHFELDRSFDTTYPIYRMHHQQQRLPMHKYQHIYMWFLYSLINFGDLFGTFDELQWMSNYPTRRGHISKTAYWTQASVKLVWLILSLIIPSYLHGWYNIFPAWTVYMMVMGNCYSWFFTVNHWTLEAGQVDNSNISNTNWGELQVVNSSNFSLGSPFWTNLSGGLNYQIEHHLFPSFNHMILSRISKIVQDTCKEFNIRYFSFPSFWSAVRSHYEFLKYYGQND